MIELILKDIEDNYSRENFNRLIKWIRSLEILKANWTFFEIGFTAGVTNYRYPHRLGYMPKDIIMTRVTDSESVIFNYDLFSLTHFDFTVSGPCTVRFFAGSYGDAL